MADSSRDPRCKVGVSGWREEAPIVLRCCCCWWLSGRDISSLLLLLLLFPLSSCLLRSLPLLPVIHEECERQGEAHDDECVNKAVIVVIPWIMRCVSAGHGVVVDIVIQPIVIKEAIILNEIIDPLAEGPVFLRFYRTKSVNLIVTYQ